MRKFERKHFCTRCTKSNKSRVLLRPTPIAPFLLPSCDKREDCFTLSVLTFSLILSHVLDQVLWFKMRAQVVEARLRHDDDQRSVETDAFSAQSKGHTWCCNCQAISPLHSLLFQLVQLKPSRMGHGASSLKIVATNPWSPDGTELLAGPDWMDGHPLDRRTPSLPWPVGCN